MLYSFFDLKLALIKLLKSYKKNEKKTLSLIRKINIKIRDFLVEFKLLYFKNLSIITKKLQPS